MARARDGGFWSGLLLVLGLALLGAGGWLQTAKPDYRRVHALVPIGPPPASATEPQPVPGSLVAICFVSGLLLVGVAVATK